MVKRCDFFNRKLLEYVIKRPFEFTEIIIYKRTFILPVNYEKEFTLIVFC